MKQYKGRLCEATRKSEYHPVLNVELLVAGDRQEKVRKVLSGMRFSFEESMTVKDVLRSSEEIQETPRVKERQRKRARYSER